MSLFASDADWWAPRDTQTCDNKQLQGIEMKILLIALQSDWLLQSKISWIYVYAVDDGWKSLPRAISMQ